MLKSGLFAALLLVSGGVFANCDQNKVYLYHLQNNQIVSQGYGDREMCSNVHNTFENWYYQSKNQKYVASIAFLGGEMSRCRKGFCLVR